MKAAFALLTDRKIYNLVRKIAWKAHRMFGISTLTTRIEPHVSLKQPFEIPDLPSLESFMHKFAASLSPLEIHLTRIQAIPTRIDNLETGILWFDVEESSALRETHNLMNAELEHRFGPTPAPFDGDAYHFHLTIAMGDQPMELYNRSAKFFKSRYANLHFTASELAMFVYDENAGLGGGYMTYIILPLGK